MLENPNGARVSVRSLMFAHSSPCTANAPQNARKTPDQQVSALPVNAGCTDGSESASPLPVQVRFQDPGSGRDSTFYRPVPIKRATAALQACAGTGYTRSMR